MNRRSFLTSTTGTVTAFPHVARSTVLGANDRVHLGFLGVGRRARHLIQHQDFGAARITAVADIYDGSIAQAVKVHPDGPKWAKHKDYRQMLEKGKLDGVFVQTTLPTRASSAACTCFRRVLMSTPKSL